MDPDEEAIRQRVDWCKTIRATPQTRQYFLKGNMRQEDWERATEYFNHLCLPPEQVNQLFGTLEVKVQQALQRGGTNGENWQSGLTEQESRMCDYLGFSGYLSNSGMLDFLRTAQAALVIDSVPK